MFTDQFCGCLYKEGSVLLDTTKLVIFLEAEMNYLGFLSKNDQGRLMFISFSKVFSKPSITGGVVLNPAYYGMPGHTNTMIHEVGHVLGLYHVFKGVSERESCDDPCRETVPSMETGDLCADTAPTPKSKLCRDPEPANDTCGFTHFSGAPFNNYMSYTGITTNSVLLFCLKVA